MELKINTPRWSLPFLNPSRYKGAYGGRGSGKSHERAEALVERCVLIPGTRWACIREVQKSLDQSVKRLLEDKIEQMGVSHLFEIKKYEIVTPGDGLIIFQGMQNHTADSIKSLEGFDGAWVEEAQTLSQYSLDMLRPTIRKPGSELWFTWNPRYETDAVEFLRGENPPPNSIVLEVNYSDNPFFPDVLKDEMEYDLKRDPDKFQHIWKGGYVKNSETRVFKNWTIDEFEAPADAMFLFGADWGFAVDPTTLVRMYIEGRTLYIDYEAYEIGCEVMDTPNLFLTIPESEKWAITADSARPEIISHMRNNGFKIFPAVKGPKSVEDGVEHLKSYDIVVHPRCIHAIDELTLYSYKTDRDTGRILPKLEDKDNHIIDAIRYALEGKRRAEKGMEKVVSVPVPTTSRW